jgi:hypothetical protein
VRTPLGQHPFHSNRHAFATVIPAEVGIMGRIHQIPAFAGTTPDERAIRFDRTLP